MASPKTRACSRSDAKTRLDQSRGFLEAAELYVDEADGVATNVAASNAVLAAIAAADAACCGALGRHAQGQDHQEATDLLATVRPGGPDAARALGRALTIKSNAQYGLRTLSKADRDATVRQAKKLIAFAQDVLDRG